MATLLLLVIYIAFIGLGIPDSLLGAAWPAIYDEFALPISMQSIIAVTSYMCTVISSALSTRIIARFGTAKVTAVSTALTALGLLGFALTNNFYMFILFVIPQGLGAGCIDAGLNNYVALHYSARRMSFLHCFYGVGVSISPYFMSVMLGGNGGWRGGYMLMAAVQAVITVICLISIPLWSRVNRDERGQVVEDEIIVYPFKKLISDRVVLAMLILVMFGVSIEVVCGQWCSTYLVEARGLPVDSAALYTTLYYAGLASGRFVSGLFVNRFGAWRLIILGTAVAGASIAAMMLPIPAVFSAATLFFIGLGIGPLFPNTTHMIPLLFGRERSQSIIGFQSSFSYLGIVVFPVLFGIIADAVSAALFAPYLLGLTAVLAICIFKMRKPAKAAMLKEKNGEI